MLQRLASIGSLVLIASILPELLSGSTPPQAFLDPAVFSFCIFAYGIPVLLIRDFAHRHSLGLTGLFLLGLGYGIINEALLAKTVFRSVDVPVDIFDGYGFVAGLQWAWAGFILPWHAMASVILPIVLTHRSFPETATQTWLGRKTAVIIALVMVGLISVFFLLEDTTGLPGPAPMLAILWTVIFALAAVALRLPRKPLTSAASPRPWQLVLLGMSGLLAVLSLVLIVVLKWPLAVYFAAALLWIAAYGLIIRHYANVDHDAMGWFGLGWYVQIGVLSWLGIAFQNPLIVPVHLAVFLLLFLLLRRKPGQRP